jgi:hypothetical protein
MAILSRLTVRDTRGKCKSVGPGTGEDARVESGLQEPVALIRDSSARCPDDICVIQEYLEYKLTILHRRGTP